MGPGGGAVVPVLRRHPRTGHRQRRECRNSGVGSLLFSYPKSPSDEAEGRKIFARRSGNTNSQLALPSGRINTSGLDYRPFPKAKFQAAIQQRTFKQNHMAMECDLNPSPVGLHHSGERAAPPRVG